MFSAFKLHFVFDVFYFYFLDLV